MTPSHTDLSSTVAHAQAHARAPAEVILDAIPVLAALVTLKGTIRFANPPLARACGWGDARPANRRLNHIVTPEAATALLDPAGGGAVRSPLRAEKSNTTIFEWSSRRIEDEALVLVTGRDISREVQLENFIAGNQWFETGAALSGGLAHDFNNVLAAILGLSELISMRLPPDSPLQTFTTKIGGSIERAKILVRRFSQLSRKSPGVTEPQPTAMILQELDPLLRAFLPGNITLATELSAETPWCQADRHSIEQIVLNCANFVRARLRADGGRLTLSSLGANDQHRAVVELTGYGQGLLGVELEHVFELDLAPTSSAYESGVGLFAAMILARNAGGSLTLRRTDPRTVVFTLELPPAADG